MFTTSMNKWFLTGAFAGVLLAGFSTSWFGVWTGLELNLFCVLPLLIAPQGAPEGGLKYFVIQACGSIFVLVGGSSFMLGWSSFMAMACIGLFLKVGSAPLHFWYLDILSAMKWCQFVMLSVVQKMAPLLLLSYISKMSFCEHSLLAATLSCSMVGGAGGVGEYSLRKLLGYSSISHLGWMFFPMCLAVSNSWGIYFLIYSSILISVVSSLSSSQMFNLSQAGEGGFKKEMNLSLMAGLFSMGGAPPFLGFMPKWLVVNDSLSMAAWGVALLLTMMSTVALFYYTRWALVMMFLSHDSVKEEGWSWLANKSYLYNTAGIIAGSTIWLSLLH